jgi:hypothetical protein
VKVFAAEVLPDNYPVLRVLGDAGLTVRRRYGDGVVELAMPVPENAALGEASGYLDAVAGPGEAGGRDQPAAPAGAPVGRGRRHGPRIDRPHHPAQHPRCRIRRPAVRGRPERRRHRGRSAAEDSSLSTIAPSWTAGPITR